MRDDVRISAVPPKQPSLLTGWKNLGRIAIPNEEAYVWRFRKLNVISAVGDMEFRGVIVPQFHVSVSVLGDEQRRATDEEMARVRRDFDMEDAEEDNHHPGRIRNLFRLVHLPPGTPPICECKESEETVVEPDGFTWQRAKS